MIAHISDAWSICREHIFHMHCILRFHNKHRPLMRLVDKKVEFISLNSGWHKMLNMKMTFNIRHWPKVLSRPSDKIQSILNWFNLLDDPLYPPLADPWLPAFGRAHDFVLPAFQFDINNNNNNTNFNKKSYISLDSRFLPSLSIRYLVNISVCMMTFARTMDIHQNLWKQNQMHAFEGISTHFHTNTESPIY